MGAGRMQTAEVTLESSALESKLDGGESASSSDRLTPRGAALPARGPRAGFGWSWLLGYDVFISYKRADSSAFVRSLAAELGAAPHNLSCFLDVDETPAGNPLKKSLQRALRRSRLLVIVVTPGVVQSKWIREEVHTFAKTGRPIIPINVGAFLDLERPTEDELVLELNGHTWLNESLEAIKLGQPADQHAPAIDKARRQLRVKTLSQLIVTAVVIGLTLGAVGFAWQWREAATEARRARAQSILNSADYLRLTEPEVSARLLQELPTHEFGDPLQNLATATRIGASQVPVAVLRGSPSPFVQAVFDDPGERLLTVSQDGTVQVWDAANGRRIATLARRGAVVTARYEHDGSISTVSRDGKLINGGLESESASEVALSSLVPRPQYQFSPDGSQVFWLIDNLHVGVHRLAERSSDRVLSSSHFVEELATSQDGTTVLAWKSSGGTAVAWLNGETEGRPIPVGLTPRVAFGKSSGVFATVSPTELRLFDLAHADNNGWIQDERDIFNAQVLRSVAFSTDGTHLVASSQEGALRVRSASKDMSHRSSANGHRAAVGRILFSRDGKSVVTSGQEQTVQVWSWTASGDGASLRPSFELHHPEFASAAAISDDGRRVVTTSGNEARIWSVGRSSPLIALGASNNHRPGPPRFSPSGALLVTTGDALTILTEGGQVVRQHKAPTADFRLARWDSRNRFVVGATARAVYLLPAHDRDEARLLFELAGEITALEISADGGSLLVGTEDGSVRLWEVGAAAPKATFRHRYRIVSMSFLQDAKSALIGSHDGVVTRWALGDAEPSPQWTNDEGTTISSNYPGKLVSSEPDPLGRLVVTAGMDGRARLARLSDGKSLTTLGDKGLPLLLATFAPDSSAVVTVSESGQIRTFSIERDVATTQTVIDLDQRLWSAKLSRDGSVIFVVEDRSAQLLRLDGSGDRVVVESPGDRYFRDGDLSSTSSRAALGATDRRARLWILSFQEVIARLGMATTACLTADQRRRYMGESQEDAKTAQESCEAHLGRAN